jgi:hypothetical protein
MTLSITNPRAKSRWTFLSILVGLGLILGMMLPMIALAAPPKISLEQCRNGSATSPNDCLSLGGSAGWVNGNAGASNAHFVEGHSIPYRALITDGPLGSNDVTLGYDIKHSGTNAIDFLTHYDRLEPHNQFGHPAEDVEPTSGVSGLNADVATCPIPKPSNLSAAAGTTFDQIKNLEDKNNFTVFGASSCTVTQGAALEGDVNQAQSEARVVVNYVATSSTVVLAWGGHIAKSADWGGNGAAQISGSPYHMRVKAWSAGNVGNQDRSLAAAAVLALQSSVATTIHLDTSHTVVPINTSIALGSSVHDLATVTGLAPTGNVTFTFYRGGDCTTGTLEAAGTVALAAVDATTSVAHPSDSKATLTAGSYAFRATYAGDGSNIGSSSDCEPFSVSKGNLTVATRIHLGTDHTTNYDRNANASASVAVNSTVHDVAVISGAVSGIATTGAITFTRWNNATCTGDGTALAANGADEGGTGTKSVNVGPLAPGDYSFKATIAADANYNTATSPCEWLRVDKATPTLATAPWVYPNDTATISNLVSPVAGSTLTITAHETNDCSDAAKYTKTYNDITNTSYPTTNNTYAVTDDSVTVYWKVVYSGDANNNGATSNCVEKIDVTFTPDPVPAP